MALPYPTKVVLPFDIATAQDMNERHANDVALAAGSGLDDEAVTADKIDFTTWDIGGEPLMQSGYVTISGGNGSMTSEIVTFPKPFASPPGVTLSFVGVSGAAIQVVDGVALGAVTSTQAVINIVRNSTANTSVAWVAVGLAP